MKIEGKETIKINGWLRMGDLDNGEVFIFEDNEDDIYLAIEDGNVVNLESGEIIECNDSYYCDKVVRRIKCKLVIEEN